MTSNFYRLIFFLLPHLLYGQANTSASSALHVNTSLTAQVDFRSSNLPIVVIDTGGQTIRNSVRIVADMGIIDNGAGVVNHLDDPFNNYNGKIAIELRGSSGLWQGWPKQQFGLETQDASGNNLNVPLLGLPEENDWILYPPYSDKSLLRNVLAYRLSRDIGRYTPRTRFCEVVLNGDYRGLYVLIEKIKRDKNRINIAKLRPEDIAGDQLTGGYIVKVDRRAGEENDGWISARRFSDKGDVEWLYHDPGPDELTPEQKSYIKEYVLAFEDKMAAANWEQELEHYFDVDAFVDYYLINELANNIDTYTFSTFFYKDRDSRGGRLTIGPVWDINLGFGNADYFVGMETEGWLLGEKVKVRDRIPFWLQNLFESRAVQERIARRWVSCKKTELAPERILSLIDAWTDTLHEAQQRNFERWPILGQYIWPNAFVGANYAEEISYFKEWISKRWLWMDGQLAPLATVEQETECGNFILGDNYPNPFNPSTSFEFELPEDGLVELAVYNLQGRRVTRLYSTTLLKGRHRAEWNGRDENGRQAASGIYFYRMDAEGQSTQKRMLLIR